MTFVPEDPINLRMQDVCSVPMLPHPVHQPTNTNGQPELSTRKAPVRGLLLSEPLSCLTRSALPHPCPSLPCHSYPPFSFCLIPGDAGPSLVHAEPSFSCLCPVPHSRLPSCPHPARKPVTLQLLKTSRGAVFTTSAGNLVLTSQLSGRRKPSFHEVSAPFCCSEDGVVFIFYLSELYIHKSNSSCLVGMWTSGWAPGQLSSTKCTGLAHSGLLL